MFDFVRAVAPRSWMPSSEMALSSDSSELGREQREDVCIQGVLEIGGRVISCTVVELSTKDACVYLNEFIAAHDSFIGQLGLLRHFGGSAVSVMVRTFTDMSLNLKFLNPIGLETFTAPADRFRTEVRRSGRAQVKIRAQIIAGDQAIPGTILNISCGGALVRTDKSCNPTSAIMIQSELLRPMGGYVRWHQEMLLGIMFNRLLPISSAEAISDTFGVNPLWLEEIIECHRD
jgi:hypothetical protein